MVQRDDFLETGGDASALADIHHELLGFAGDADTVVILYEPVEAGAVRGMIHTQPPRDARDAARAFGARGSASLATFAVDGTADVQSAVQHVIPVLESKI